ncbi:MAG: DUF4304 domain-containing protein [Bryobacterales bacterium]|nr:DUF4304 domain-containing protein [Bryobacterales bacterium]
MARSSSFDLLVTAVAAALKRKGYRRAGKTLWCSNSESWGVVEFQRSTESSSDVTIFTVNLGTASKALRQFFGKPETRPSFEECHWKNRIGFTLPTAGDKWWHLTGGAVAGIASEVIEALTQHGLPEIESHMCDASVRREWMSGSAPGLTETDRLRFLSALLHIEGDLTESATVSARLKALAEERPTAGLAEMHLRKLSSRRSGG